MSKNSIPLKDFKMTNTQYQSGITLNEYSGKFSIASATSTDDGIFLDWCFRSLFKDGRGQPADKSMPMSVQIGDSREEAVKTLRFLLKQLGVGDAPESEPPPF